METGSPLRIRLLGEMQIALGDGPAAALPASKKTRALLGYLIATGRAHRRERLCDLFWDGPDDPRAELRWCLSKIRPLFAGGGAELTADRQRVGVELRGAVVDLVTVRSLLGRGVAAASPDALRQAASLIGGEFLDGLDLPACYIYQEWCMAEREAVSRMRLAALQTLAERLHDRPEEALPYARSITIADPLCEAGHAAVVRLLSRLGRNKEASAHYEHARRIFETELGAAPTDELEQARRALKIAAAAGRTTARSAARPSSTPLVPERSFPAVAATVGRARETALIERLVASTEGQADEIVLVSGAAGIGKSHLLGCFADHMASAGGRVWRARGFEPESTRPYGIWFDLLRAVAHDRPRGELPEQLGVLLPGGGEAAPADRSGLYDAVGDLLRRAAAERPAAILLDDIQWIDEASSSLLHFVVRSVAASAGLLVVCAARDGEIDDNAAAAAVFRSLARDGRLLTLVLNRLDQAETTELVRRIDPAAEAEGIYAQSGGNPLFAIELAHAHRRGDLEPGPTMASVIAGQFARLSDRAREALLWAAAFGRAFSSDDLARVWRAGDLELLATLGELERHGLLRPIGDDAYDFVHDVVRQTAYRSLSQPRRKLLHRRITRVLDEASGPDGALASDAAYHAALADDHEAASRACARAGGRALRLFANPDAASFAERGLRHIERLAETAETVGLRVELLRIRILAAAGPGMRPLPALGDAVAAAAARAEELGLHAAAATAHYLLSVLHQDAGETRQAESSTLRAAAAGDGADELTRARQLANTARCLLELETGIARSRELIRDGARLAEALGVELCELHWARGLLHRWDGQPEQAVAAIGRALALARKDEDRWREYKCLTWLALLEQELGRCAEMQARCAELRTVAERLDEDETPFVATLQALALLGAGDVTADDALADAFQRLRAVDDKSYLAYALNSAARHYLRAKRLDRVRLCAQEALSAAFAMRRRSEVAVARALLARIGGADDLAPPSAEPGTADPDGLSFRARATLQESA